MTTPVALGTLSGEERVRLGAAGLRTFFNIAERWKLSIEDQLSLLGDVSRSTYYEWKKQAPTVASVYSTDLLTRLSYVLGIHGTLQRLYNRAPAFADAWVAAPNSGRAFRGVSPLERMRADGIPGMLLVRRLLESLAGGGMTAGQEIDWDHVGATSMAPVALPEEPASRAVAG
jgi:hypothetical protein